MNLIQKFYKKPTGERRCIILSLIAFLLCTGLGVLSHFAFKFLGESMLAAAVFPVNESIGEHLKLSFFPYLLLIPLEYVFYGKRVNNFLFGKLLGVLTAIGCVMGAYYTLNGAFGKTPDFVNIIIYVIATALSYIVPYIFYKHDTKSCSACRLIAIVGFLAIGILMLAFSFYPPMIPLYLDPQGAGYGYYMI